MEKLLLLVWKKIIFTALANNTVIKYHYTLHIWKLFASGNQYFTYNIVGTVLLCVTSFLF